MPRRIERFRSKESYRKSRAYQHIHGIKTSAKRVRIAGRLHTIRHTRARSRKKV